ncbi:MAG: terminase small subunit [Candidatus Omnitrophota bacterium]
MKLSAKQSRFIEEYLVDLNATRAAIRAGYSPKTAEIIGFENLRKPKIQKAIEDATKQQSERTQIKADEVVKELARIAFSDIRQVIEWDESGKVTVKPSSEIKKDAARGIVEITRRVASDGAVTLKIKMADKLGALNSLGKHLGMFIEKIEHSGSVQGGVLLVPSEVDQDSWLKTAAEYQANLLRKSDEEKEA